MAISPFLPSLAALRNSEDCKARRCIWTKISTGGKPPEQCSRTILDGGKTRELLQRLKETRDTRCVLADIAALQLCGRSHREKNIRLVVDEWSREIERGDWEHGALVIKPNPSRSSDASTAPIMSEQSPGRKLCRTQRVPSIRTSVSIPAITPSILRRILQIDEGYNLKCHGYTIRNSRCKMPLARATCITIDNIVESLASSFSKPAEEDNVRRLLEELAGLALCRRYHQAEALDLGLQWLPKMADIGISTKAGRRDFGDDERTHDPCSPTRTCRSPLCPATPRTTSDSPESTRSTMWSRSSQDYPATPVTSPRQSTPQELEKRSPLSFNTRAIDRIEALRDDSEVKYSATAFDSRFTVAKKYFTQQSSASRKSSLRTSRVESPTQDIPTFLPFPIQSTQKMLVSICEVISRPLSNQDQETGCIYGFQRGDNGYIKVGVTTVGLETRMKQWAQSCHYEPKVMLKIEVRYAFRVERLIQVHLRKERFRESLVNGSCNSGKGCPKKHDEWFKIGLERLRKVVTVWKRFVESEPYDENNHLKPYWQQQLKKIDLSSNIDPWITWLERILDSISPTAVQTGIASEKLTRVKVEVRLPSRIPVIPLLSTGNPVMSQA
jgi:hypothetical protein